MHKGVDNACVNDAEEQQRLEDGVAELRCRCEEGRCALRLGLDEVLHLADDVEKLGWRDGGKRATDCVGGCEVGIEVDSRWEWWKC